MIDDVTFKIPVTKAMDNKLNVLRHSHQRGASVHGNKLYVRHPYANRNLKIWIDDKHDQLVVNESLPKVLQGHNVVGSNRLHDLCLAVTVLIYDRVGLEFSREEEQIIDRRNDGLGFRLGKLDCTISWLLASQEQVCDCMAAIFDHVRAVGRDWSAYGRDNIVETVYHRQHSTRVPEKFYNKYRDLLAHPIPDSVPHKADILKLAEGLFRAEFRWFGKELVDRGLQFTKVWTSGKVREEIECRVGAFDFPGVLKTHLEPTELDGLNLCSSTFYRIWRKGVDLKPYRKYTPLQRARTAIRQHQVDIWRQPRTGSEVSIKDALTACHAIFSYPPSMRRIGAVFVPDEPTANSCRLVQPVSLTPVLTVGRVLPYREMSDSLYGYKLATLHSRR